jgi:glycosyltransferase involved in cell wall biosynthesis
MCARIARMKYIICHVTTVHEADDVRIFYKECLSLSKIKNYKVIICAPGSIPVSSNVVHHKIPKASSYRPLRFFNSQLIAVRLVTKVKASIWHIHDPELLPLAVLLILMKRRVIWDSHEDYFSQFDSSINYRKYIPSFLRPIVKLMVNFLLRFIDKKASGIIGATESIAKKYKNNNIAIVGNQVVLNDFSLCKPKYTNKTVIYIGQPSPDQCYREVVKAISKVPNLSLVLACRDISNSEKEFSAKILGHRFHYLGWLNREELSSAISDSVVGLVTYSYNSNHQDNQPNKFYEFCAAGLPILATPTKFNNDLVKNSKAGVISSGYDSKAIEEALVDITKSKIRWHGYSQSGKNWVYENGSWAKSEQSLLKLYSKVLIGAEMID